MTPPPSPRLRRRRSALAFGMAAASLALAGWPVATAQGVRAGDLSVASGDPAKASAAPLGGLGRRALGGLGGTRIDARPLPVPTPTPTPAKPSTFRALADSFTNEASPD